MGFVVIDRETGERLRGIPTPRLIEAGPAEAYFEPGEIREGGVWYLREDPRFVSRDGTYRRVAVRHTEEYRVDFVLTPDPSEDADPREDYAIVEAYGDADARREALSFARRMAEDRYELPELATIRVEQVRRGGLLDFAR